MLGANDGIISTASLLAGIAASTASKETILLTGIAALVGGALSMATGEYVSVSSQADTERADLAREKSELEAFPEAEAEELTQIYIARGLHADLARQVAVQLMEKDALQAHARDELGLSEHLEARPVQAAVTSAITFAAGACFPLLTAFLTPRPYMLWSISICALGFLFILGLVGAQGGGANPWRAAIRVTFWGTMALGVTALIGHLFGAVV